MSIPLLFDRDLFALRRLRAEKHIADHSFLLEETASRLKEKLEEELAGDYPARLELWPRGHILCHPERSEGFHVTRYPSALRPHDSTEIPALPAATYDLITCNAGLHFVNDLPGCFRAIHTALKPGGLFLASMFGGESLRELRTALMQAETMLSGGVSPRISPFTLVKDAGRLIHHAGFIEPVADGDIITVLYKSIFDLMHDLRSMGETNMLIERNKICPPRLLFEAADRFYHEQFANEEGLIPATFEVITLTGWK